MKIWSFQTDERSVSTFTWSWICMQRVTSKTRWIVDIDNSHRCRIMIVKKLYNANILPLIKLLWYHYFIYPSIHFLYLTHGLANCMLNHLLSTNFAFQSISKISYQYWILIVKELLLTLTEILLVSISTISYRYRNMVLKKTLKVSIFWLTEFVLVSISMISYQHGIIIVDKFR